MRSARPRLVIEVGSGFSTLVLDQAARRNAEDGAPARLVTIDPYPSPLIARLETELHPVRGTEVPLSEFEALEAGDILFCDTTHTVKLGSEVNYLILEVLPRLAPGVLVHFHDVFLPWEYPRKWPLRSRWYWSERSTSCRPFSPSIRRSKSSSPPSSRPGPGPSGSPPDPGLRPRLERAGQLLDQAEWLGFRAVRNPRDFFKPLAIGAPDPITEVPFGPRG